MPTYANFLLRWPIFRVHAFDPHLLPHLRIKIFLFFQLTSIYHGNSKCKSITATNCEKYSTREKRKKIPFIENVRTFNNLSSALRNSSRSECANGVRKKWNWKQKWDLRWFLHLTYMPLLLSLSFFQFHNQFDPISRKNIFSVFFQSISRYESE
jgi:hypothetical protein